MTGGHPGLDPELLADLDAGVLDDDRAAQVRAAAAADPRATAVLAALAATRADLAALPDPPVPAHVAAQWDAALAAEAGRPGARTPGATPPTGAGRRHRAGRIRRFRPRPAQVAAAVLAAVLAGSLFWARPAVPDAGRLPSLDQVDLAGAARAALGATDTGGLADPGRRAACLRFVAPPGVAPDAPLLGGRRVETGGAEAVLLLLSTGELGRFHVVVVDAGCGPDGGRLLRSEVIGR
jgi:hypothetical protein